jgi:N-acetylglucosamine-6-phosphate deacetylase
MLTITNATLYTPDRRIDRGALVLDAGRIAGVGTVGEVSLPPGGRTIDASGLIAAPGFIDLQFNGGFGRDFTNEPGAIWDVAAGLPRYGVAAFLPTIITSPPERVAEAREVVTGGRPAGHRGARPLGLHVEGPFLNPQKKGAHNPAYLRPPDARAVSGWSPDTGIRIVTLAPELPGALDVIAALRRRGVLVSAGHSAATYAQAMTGFDAGVRYGTHLFNAMPALQHREPGLPGALLTDPRPWVGFIADAVHTHPAIVALAWRMLGPRRLTLVTDAMAALGMPPGSHRLADFEVTVDATSARLADGTLAGSILSLDQALRNLVRLAGCTLEEALPTLTSTPAAAIGEGEQRGRLARGLAADVVLLSADLHVRGTIVGGEIAYWRDESA